MQIKPVAVLQALHASLFVQGKAKKSRAIPLDVGTVYVKILSKIIYNQNHYWS